MPTYNQIIVPVTEHQRSQPLTLTIFDKTNKKQSKGEIILQLGNPYNIDQPSYNKILLHEKNTTQVEEHTPPPSLFITNHKIYLVDSLVNPCYMNYPQDSE